MKRTIVGVALLVAALLLVSCTAGPNGQLGTPNAEGVVAGFWLGLWHGLIGPITFLISLFSKTVHVYEVHNSGGWYDFGFLLGLSITFGGGAGGSARRARRPR